MDPETVSRIAELQSWIGILCIVIVILCCYIVASPEIDRRLEKKPVPIEFCKLHSRPVTECRNQHKLGGPDEPH